MEFKSFNFDFFKLVFSQYFLLLIYDLVLGFVLKINSYVMNYVIFLW